MHCDQIDERYECYALGALSEAERAQFDEHLAGCIGEHPQLVEAIEAMGAAASSALRVPAPNSVGRGLFSRVDRELGRSDFNTQARDPSAASGGGLSRWWNPPWGSFAHPATAAVAIFLALITGGVIWLDYRIDSVQEETLAVAKTEKMLADVMADQESLTEQVGDMVRSQQALTFMASNPDGTVHMLQSTDAGPTAQGMAAVSGDGRSVMLAVSDMPALPTGMVYRVWLSGGGGDMDGGVLSVDSAGYGQMLLRLTEPMSTYNTISIMVEPEDHTNGPAGAPILMGDL